jgi:hypothetical protein
MVRAARLGDDIDDFCVKCKRVMNHSVVSILNSAPAKVRCRTCHSDHDFRNEQAPPPKVDMRKQALFNEVLKKVDPAEAALGAQALDAEALAEDPVEVEVEAEAEAEDVAIEAAAGVEEEPPTPAPKAKAKAKAKTATTKATPKARK